ncbi:MAG: LacI family DNA-binding transcriptional regulator [Oscillospiraceae bacterium]|nr:LacI family DNA-binding transcriptional regulator [Oscillospiraceae bacterium]
MAKLTTREIARMAGVSPTAVSFALNGKEGISQDTRRKILDLVQKLGYEPTKRGRIARDRSLRYNRIAIVSERKYDVNYLFCEFHSTVLNCFLLLCSKNNMDTVITNVPNIAEEFRMPDTLMFEDIDGVLVMSNIQHSYLDKIRSMHLPLLEFNADYSYPGQNAVRIDYHHAVCMATQHLLDLGHRDIAYFGSNEYRDQTLRLFTGFRETLLAHSPSIDLRRIQMNLEGGPSLEQAVDVQLQVQPWPTAILCASGNMAIEVMQALQARGVRVPEDISVVAISDISHSKFTSPGLSAVHIPPEEIAKLTFDALMRQINHNEAESILFTPSELIQRGSSAPVGQTNTER